MVNKESKYLSRRKPAEGVLIHPGKPVIVYITVCTDGRLKWLANVETHEALVSIWKNATAWKIGRYMIMPDHIHAFAGFNGSEITLKRWVTYWKSIFTKTCGKHGQDWQSGCWDRRLRTGESYESKWEYVRNNPVRHGLVEKPEDWPYQGVIHDLEW